mmetsp:Transcript_24220/g.40115  ORF Transcript_24220/g.40115 Transcript_24220/m.40115 type:complete len:203 (-) Transcript_24220:279-887(-)
MLIQNTIERIDIIVRFMQILRLIVVGIEIRVAHAILLRWLVARPLVSITARWIASSLRTRGRFETIRLSEHVVQVTLPRNARFQHVNTRRCQQNLVVEERVGRETAGIQTNITENVERITESGVQCKLSLSSKQLIDIAALLIGSMVLVKILNLIVDHNRRFQILVGGEGNCTREVCVCRCIDSTVRMRAVKGIVLHYFFIC